MNQKETGYKKKGGIRMALLATPSKSAFRISEKNVDILNKKNGAVLNALQKIRSVESAQGNTMRVHQLDGKICTLQAKSGSKHK